MVSPGATRLLKLLQSFARRSGRAFPYHRTLAKRLHCSEPTLRRWIAELRRDGLLETQQRGRTSALYAVSTAVGIPVETDQANDQANDQAKPAHKGMSKEPELRLSKQVARKPPSREVETYRQNFQEAYQKLWEGWTEPAGGRVPRQISMFPNPDIMPALADSARAAALEPTQAILSLDGQLRRAQRRVLAARNPSGLIIHIARDTWKAS